MEPILQVTAVLLRKLSKGFIATGRSILLVLFLFCYGPTLVAQEATTMGTDFWISYLYFTYEYTAPQYHVTLHAFASGPRACTVTMSNPNTTWSTSFAVTPGQVTFIDVPYGDGCTSLSGAVTPSAIHVTSTDTISLYLITLGHFNIDMTNALPTASLGSDYMIQCYPSKLSTDFRSEFVIVATEDNTVVDIVPSANTLNGFSAGTLHTVTLQQGDAYQLRGASNAGEADLTGSRITARDCKKIAVFSGHFCAYVPTNTTTCDHIYDQSFPIGYWGQHFAVAGTGTVFADHVRVMALEDGCSVNKDGVHVATLNSGQVYDFTLTSSNRTAYIETSSPASVYMFLGSAGVQNGDPSMIIVNPVDQRVKDITFATYSTTYTNTHYVTIVASAEEMQYVRLDNNPVASQAFAGNSNYRYAKVQISDGSHSLKTLGTEGFIAYAFGIGLHESYGYSVGSSLKVIGQSTLFYNGVPVESGDTIVLCANTAATFHVGTDSGSVSGEWYMDSDTVGMLDTIDYLFVDTGIYHLSVRSSVIQHFDCYGVLESDDEMNLVVIVKPHYLLQDDDSIIVGLLPWHYMGNTYYDSVRDDTIRTTTVYGCDSVILYSLYVYDSAEVDIYDTICAGMPYHDNGFDLSAEETAEVGEFQYRQSIGTTITTLHLMQIGAPHVRIDYTSFGDSCFRIVCYTEADSVVWSSMPYDSSLASQQYNATITVCPEVPTIYSVTAYFSGHSECSHVQSVDLLPRTYVHNQAELWVPNVFTPQLMTNNLFRAYGEGIAEFEMFIYQRWGMMLFHSKSIDEGWDGTYKNALCPSGTYAYLIYYRSKYSPAELQKRMGSVTLIR